MEGNFDSATLVAPKPNTPFEAYVIKSLQGLNEFAVRTTASIDDLIESVVHISNTVVTKEEFEERLESVETKMVTKEDLKKEFGAVEHRIKSYIDDKVVTENVIPVIQKEDKKVNDVIDSLEENSVFSSTEAEYLKKQGPFPQLA